MVRVIGLIIGVILVCGACLIVSAPPLARAAELARFEIREPLGQTWTDEWLTHEVKIHLGDRQIKAGQLQLNTGEGEPIPSQFYLGLRWHVLSDSDEIEGSHDLKVLFKATIKQKETVRFALTDQGTLPRPRRPVTIIEHEGKAVVETGGYEAEFDRSDPLPINALRCGSACGTLGRFAWPEGVEATRVEDVWLERGPVRAVLKRVFTFKNPAHRYELVLDFRAGDPWLDVTDTYALGPRSAIQLDLTGMNADVVYHPYTYNARTFGTGGPHEDSTLQPPQHPIATLGPIWRDIWFNGGPFAFVYNSKADHGIGFAAVRGGEWDTPSGITPESQNLEIYGDREVEGEVKVRIPTDGGHRRWAIILGSPIFCHLK